MRIDFFLLIISYVLHDLIFVSNANQIHWVFVQVQDIHYRYLYSV